MRYAKVSTVVRKGPLATPSMEPIRPANLLLTLDGAGPRYSQITRALRLAIQNELIGAGARLPATRHLARDLGCSRNIVLLAYEQLVLEGYLSTRKGAGTFVAARLPLPGGVRSAGDVRAPAAPRLSQRGRVAIDAAAGARAAISTRPGMNIDFMYGLCEPDAKVVASLRAALHRSLRSRAFGYGSPMGELSLRQQIAHRIRASRGISRSAEQIVITSGAQQALDICARLLLDPDDCVVVEDPGYASVQAALIAAGARLIRVPVDQHGLDASLLPNDRKRIRAAYVTPSHQFPTGAVMPAARRHALLEWAKRRDAYVIEDDYDGEFRYAGRPIAALAALDTDRVIYCGTFAKTLFPSMRLGYVALPPNLVHHFAQGKWLSDLGSSSLLQQALAQLMATGEYDRHIGRMQQRYRDRRLALLAAFKRHFGDEASVEGSAAGLHVVVWLPRLPRDRVTELLRASAARGLGIHSIAGHATRVLPHAGLLIGYGLADADQITRGVRILKVAYREIVPNGRE